MRVATVEATVHNGLLELPDGTILSSPRLLPLEGQTVRVAAKGSTMRTCYPPDEATPFVVWVAVRRSHLEHAAEQRAEILRDERRRLRSAIGTVRPRAKH
jgi:hypothetical protein